MISLKPIIVMLSDKPVWFEGLWFRRVDGAAAYAQVRPEALPLPAAWVVRSADKGEPIGERLDRDVPEFDVVIAIENARSHVPGDTDEQLLKYRQAVYRLLRGEQGAPDTRPIEWRGGHVIEYTDGDLYWADRYSFEGLFNNYLSDQTPFDQLIRTGGALL
ncbi:MAG: hypothetical protein PHH47_13065 [Gallionella sp.]|nr:hypothetical protein [Gallionella sp.]MDD4947440.1 hypothetical protein [Gallionella sp.]